MAFLLKALNAIVVFILLALLMVPLLQIVLRYVFGTPIVGAEELTRFLMILLVFLAYPLVVRQGENIVMGELRAMLPAGCRGSWAASPGAK